MKLHAHKFIDTAQKAINNPNLQSAVDIGTKLASDKRDKSLFADGIEHGEKMRDQAAAIKKRCLNQLPGLLEKAEANMIANGIKVLWASEAAEANEQVLEIARNHRCYLAAKSKSMATEETGLNEYLESAGIEVVETDLGEFIVQLCEETPSHIVVPIVHKTKASIRDTLIKKTGMPYTDSTDEMTRFARTYLREKFLQADLGISGGNFIIAETGSLALVTNEGNGRMVTSLPNVHVALVGIEKIIETVEDYATLTQILPRSATGQSLTTYTQMINGPRHPEETDGPKHVYVIFLDNGRSSIYTSKFADSLPCIRCGACLNACPVYQVTGGHAYGWVYPGPIGSILTPLFNGLQNAKVLPDACSLCGKCKEVCPVKIDLPRMLLELRHETVDRKLSNKLWDIGIKLWAAINKSPKMYQISGRIGASMCRVWPFQNYPWPINRWTKYRSIPQLKNKSFTNLWMERQLKQEKNDRQPYKDS
ncbi:MAG: iron-sulfur cluster-binding protein [Calditrichaeota bacterium]|nr:MAG: iron-sulfur cluster-binding protein [Calditrichota bacterium]